MIVISPGTLKDLSRATGLSGSRPSDRAAVAEYWTWWSGKRKSRCCRRELTWTLYGPPARFFWVMVVDHLQGVILSNDWGTSSYHVLFFDQGVRANCPCIFEQSRTTRTEEFRYVDCIYADELVFAAHRNLVRGHDIG